MKALAPQPKPAAPKAATSPVAPVQVLPSADEETAKESDEERDARMSKSLMERATRPLQMKRAVDTGYGDLVGATDEVQRAVNLKEEEIEQKNEEERKRRRERFGLEGVAKASDPGTAVRGAPPVAALHAPTASTHSLAAPLVAATQSLSTEPPAKPSLVPDESSVPAPDQPTLGQLIPTVKESYATSADVLVQGSVEQRSTSGGSEGALDEQTTKKEEPSQAPAESKQQDATSPELAGPGAGPAATKQGGEPAPAPAIVEVSDQSNPLPKTAAGPATVAAAPAAGGAAVALASAGAAPDVTTAEPAAEGSDVGAEGDTGEAGESEAATAEVLDGELELGGERAEDEAPEENTVAEEPAPATEATGAEGGAPTTESEVSKLDDVATSSAVTPEVADPALSEQEPATDLAPVQEQVGANAEALGAAAVAEGAEPGVETAADTELPSGDEDAATASIADDAANEGAEPAVGTGGGGGGGAPMAPPKAEPAPPNVSSMKPADALSTMASLSPVAMQQSLGGLTTSVANDVGARRVELAAAPPSLPRPTGSPMTKSNAAGPPVSAVAAGSEPKRAEPIAPGADVQTPAPTAILEAPAASIQDVSTPAITPNPEGNVSASDADRMRTQIASMTVSDPQLTQTAGPAPTLALQGNADPTQMLAQQGNLRRCLVGARSQGAEDAAVPMGEQTLYPDVPEEQLTASVGNGVAKAGSPGAAGVGSGVTTAVDGGGANANALSIIAAQERGGEISASIAQAQSRMVTAEAEQRASAAEAEQIGRQRIADAEAQNSKEQAAERQRAQGEVSAQRSEWIAAQQEEIGRANTEANQTVADANSEVARQRADANQKATDEIRAGNERAEQAHQEGERQAQQERDKGAKQPEGFFGWVASKATAFFDSIKAGIKKALDAARAMVKKALEAAKKFATEIIEKARKWIVDKIKAVGNFLIALSDRVLAAFPRLRERFRNAIKAVVSLAERAVNLLAEGLKKTVQLYLDAWGKVLDVGLGLLQAGLNAAVDAVAATVKGAIEFAKSVVDKLGIFAQLISDIAADPIGWLSNLGAAVVSGIRDHLWSAFKAAVKEWFNAKLEAVVGVGKAIWQVVTGKLGFAAIAKMAWQAIIAMLPPVLIRILIEKLVALIVPAAGALMVIVEGLQAAWGTISQIIAAVDKFIAFLKAVKDGGAGPKFAAALASAAIVVLDFVANFLIAKLASGLKKLASKLGAIAKKLMRKLKKRGGRKRGRGRSGKGKRKAKKKDEKEKIRKRVERAQRELPPKLSSFLAKKPNRVRLAVQLRIWRAMYRMRSLEVTGTESVVISGVINPRINLGKGWSFTDAHLMRLVKEVAEEFVIVQDEVPQAAAPEPAVDLQSKDLTGAVPLPGAMNEAASMKLGEGIVREHRATVGSFKMGGARAIVEPGKEGGLTYPQIKSALGNANPGPLLESLFVDPMHPNFTGLDARQQAAAETLFSLFLKESTHPKGSGRHGRDLLHGAMLTQLLTTSDPEHAITGQEAIDLFPAGFKGAQAGTKTVTNKLDTPQFQEFKVKGLGLATKERHKRERQLLEKWGKMHLPKWKLIHPTKPDDATMKKLIREALAPLLARIRRAGESSE